MSRCDTPAIVTSLLSAEARFFTGADIEAGIDGVFHRLAVDQLDHDVRRTLTHLERPLADLYVAATVVECPHLRRQGVAGDDDEVIAGEPVHDLVSHLGVGLRGELGPTANED